MPPIIEVIDRPLSGHFAALLRAWRERALLTQDQLAARTGMGVRTIRRLESGGVHRPRSGSVRLLGDALGLTDAERAQLATAAKEAPSPAPATTPRQLPADVAGFAGRTEQLRKLDGMLAAARDQPATVVISAITGTAGVGKTALALHFAHRAVDTFPDGQLYVNLRGFDPSGTPYEPAAAIRGLLDALGVPPPRLPADLEAQSALYRSLLAGRRVLVVLDNARDAEQVRPLLPGTAGSLVLVTSRNQLFGLVAADGAVPLMVDLLSTAEALELVARRLGADRVAAEPAAVEEIIQRCARLPLALAVAAARTATCPELPLAALAAELREAAGGLDAFDTGDASADLRAVLGWSYQRIGVDAARLFRLLALHPGPDIGAPAAASLAGVPSRRVRPLLAELVRAHLLTEHPPGRYAYHDLLRAYATELAHHLDPAGARRDAVHRLLDHYVHSAYAGSRLLNPTRDPITLTPPQPGSAPAPPADRQCALAWFADEHRALVAAVDHAATTGWDDHTWQLAWALGDFLDLQARWHELATTQLAALTAATRLADKSGQARAHGHLARAYTRLTRFDDAHAHFRRALDLYRQLGDRLGQAHTHYSTAFAADREGRCGDALGEARRALELYQQAGHRHRQAFALDLVGSCHAQLGSYEEALAFCQQAITLHRELGNRHGEAGAWDTLGLTHHRLGQYRRAVTCYRHALDLLREFADRYHEAMTLTHLGDTHDRAGDAATARDAWRGALVILEELDHPDADQLRAKLADVDRASAPEN
jgi:tetratricopeptide (TPR) repeat protein/transcriptional regulator with XRE-family HTH domain